MELHSIEDRDVEYYEQPCKYCGKLMTLSSATSHRVNCSQKCVAMASRKFEITPEELHELVWSMPTVEVAKRLGISDVAVGKRCKRLWVDKPPRGYWRKVETGTI